MMNKTFAIAMTGVLLAGPGFAQTATTPATEPAPAVVVPADAPVVAGAAAAPEVVITVPEGYVLTELTTVTGDELKGVDIYDPSGAKIAEIADIQIGPDSKVNGIITDVGGFLGLGEHRVLLSPDQIKIYKNTDNDIRAYVSMTKDELKALPKYVAPN